jgi:hypothetical protein
VYFVPVQIWVFNRTSPTVFKEVRCLCAFSCAASGKMMVGAPLTWDRIYESRFATHCCILHGMEK